VPSQSTLDAVTGATGYSGKHIARRLLDRGHAVLTLTNHPERPNPFGQRVRAAAFNFDRPDELRRSLEGVTTLYNTYWIRYAHGGMTHEIAVANTKILFKAAQEAGVERVVHISITNPSPDSPLSYFRGKAELEQTLAESGLSYAILRPAVLFGGQPGEDILINNMAWLLRRFPFFAVMGDGTYGLQPIHVEDLAELAVEQGQRRENMVLDAVGPEAHRFIDLVRLIKREVGSRALIVRTPPLVALGLSQIINPFVGDVLLTRDEVVGLMADLLLSDQEPTGKTRLSEWLHAQRDQIGRVYGHEVRRHFR
jgi:NADH dehydrogenase